MISSLLNLSKGLKLVRMVTISLFWWVYSCGWVALPSWKAHGIVLLDIGALLMSFPSIGPKCIGLLVSRETIPGMAFCW